VRYYDFSEKQSRVDITQQSFVTRVTPENLLLRTISRRQLPRFPDCPPPDQEPKFFVHQTSFHPTSIWWAPRQRAN